MPRELVLPELAESVVEGEIVKWLVAEGGWVAQDQPLVEVMTDKVTVELPSPFAGTLEAQLVAEGAVVAVHTPIARFADEGDGAQTGTETQLEGGGVTADPTPTADLVLDEPDATERVTEAPEDDGDARSLFRASADEDAEPVFQLKRADAPATPGRTTRQTTGPFGRPLAVPAARKLARELGIDLTDVKGSGPNGRIRVDDVRGAVQTAPAATPSAPGAPAYKTPAGYEGLETRVPVRGLRRAIREQMVASHLQTVRTLHVDEADVTGLVALRAKLKPLAEKQGVRLSYLPFIMKATVAALRAFPALNSSLDEEKSEVVLKRFYNLGLAVATEAGLVVPVVKDVDKKSLLEVADDVNTLAAKARDGKLAPEDVKGGTFSVTNIGSIGGLFSFPIINTPEAAILGVHSIKKRPVVLADDTIAARQMLYLSLSFDHRLVDGAEAAGFTGYLIELLETPEALMLES